jgi:hypothetical protein
LLSNNNLLKQVTKEENEKEDSTAEFSTHLSQIDHFKDAQDIYDGFKV